MTETNLEIFRRDTPTFTITVLNDGVAVDITGYTLFFTAKNKKSDTDLQAIIKKDVTVLSDPTHGIAEITLDKTDTDITGKDYFYDIQIVSGDGDVTTLFWGVLTVIEDVTIRTTEELS